jgi:hypothetical protein
MLTTFDDLAAIQKLQATGGFSQVIVNIGIILASALMFFAVTDYKFSKNNDVKIFV